MNDSSAHVIAYPALSVVLAVILGCQPGPDDLATGKITSDGVRSDALASTPSVATERPERKEPVTPAWPKSGEALVEINERGITVASNGASQLMALEKLAKLAGFTIVVGDTVPASLRGTLVDAEVHQALSFILTGLPYATSYAIDTSKGHHKLAEVRVGASVEDEPSVTALEERIEVSQDALGSAARWHADHPNLSLQLADSDPQARVKVLETLDAESDDISVLAEIVANDPDAQVRMVAINQLYFVQSYAAIQIALTALQDPDPRVVIAALNLIEAWYDQSLLPNIELLRQHSSAEVRMRATEIIALLE